MLQYQEISHFTPALHRNAPMNFVQSHYKIAIVCDQIIRLVFKIEKESVSCEVRTEILYIRR